MLDRNCEPTRWGITHEYARWATKWAMSGLGRNRSVNTSQPSINSALDTVDFDVLFNIELGQIGDEEFQSWHEGAVNTLQEVLPGMSFGWAAKMIAIYLKTTCYMSGFGRENLDRVIYPPIDRRLLSALPKRMWKTDGLHKLLTQAAEKQIVDIDARVYNSILALLWIAACELDCTLFEIDQCWCLKDP